LSNVVAPASPSTADARLPAVAFGRALLDSLDLDPIYVMLARSGLDRPALARWCLAYWCYYHAGVASRVADAPDFWGAMARADREKWPRGAERRHFRGAAAAAALDALARRFPRPEAAVASLPAGPAPAVMAAVRGWRGFGPCSAIKVADMLDRVLGVPVDWWGTDLAFYAEPAAAALLVARLEGLPADVPTVVNWLLDRLPGRLAPPTFDRRLGPAEVETILCKFKAHHAGRYPVGKDTREIRRGLAGWGPTAERLAPCLPDPPARSPTP
jgi:hypothetical protein